MGPTFLNLLLWAVCVRKKQTCKVAWTDAGFTRHGATLSWAVAWLIKTGSHRSTTDVPILLEDMFPSGIEKVTRDEIKQLHALIGTWLSFWSARRPATTLEDAMLALTVRLISAKRGWIAERTSPFPFTECLAGIANEDFEKTFRNEHVDSGVSLSEYGSLF